MPSITLHHCTFEGCDKSFKKLSKLNRHLSTHSDERPFQCTFCSKTYKRQEHLNVHLLSHRSHENERKPHACPTCGKRFISSYHMMRHQKSHLTPRPYQCTYEGCSAQFAKHSKLREHVCTHTGQSPYICEVCDKGFMTASKLKNHKQTHAKQDGLQYLCSFPDCEERFSKWSHLQKHISSSHKSVCSICDKTFSRPSILQEHMQIHDPNRILIPCTFSDCCKFFKSRKSLAVHIRTFHEGARPFSCEICSKSFAHKHLLIRHAKVHSADRPAKSHPTKINETTESYVTAIAGRSLDTNVYPFSCRSQECLCQFKRRYDLERHISSCHKNHDVAMKQSCAS